MLRRGLLILLLTALLALLAPSAPAADDAFLASLTPEERAFLAAHPVIRVGAEKDWAPYDFADADGNHMGIAADFIAVFAEKLGIEFRVTLGPTWDNLLNGLREHEYDLLPAVWRTPDREKFIAFSAEYGRTSQFIFTREGQKGIQTTKDLRGRRVATIRGYATEERLLALDLSLELVRRDNALGALRAVIAGEADAFVGDIGSVSYQMEVNSLAGLTVAGNAGLGANGLHMGLRDDWQILAGILSKVIAGMTVDERRAIIRFLDAAQDGDLETVRARLDAGMPVDAMLPPKDPRYLDTSGEPGRLVHPWNLIVPEKILNQSWGEVA